MSEGNLLDEEMACEPYVPLAWPATPTATLLLSLADDAHSDSEGSAVSLQGASSTVSTAVLAPTGSKKSPPSMAPYCASAGEVEGVPERAAETAGAPIGRVVGCDSAVSVEALEARNLAAAPVEPGAADSAAQRVTPCEPTVADSLVPESDEACNRGPEAAVVAAERQSAPSWHSEIQGPWETSRLGSICVTGEFVQCDSGARFGLSLAADGRIALANWRANVQPVSNKLEWTRLDDPAGQDLVLWVRPASYDASSEACLKTAQDKGSTEEKQVVELAKSRFEAFQGRWDTTSFGSLCVSGDAVRYDASAQGEEPLRLAVAEDGRIALLFWKAEVQPDLQTVRWTQAGSAAKDDIIWVRLLEGAPTRHVQPQLEQSVKPLRAPKAQRKQLPAMKPRAPDKTLQKRLPTPRRVAQDLARELARAERDGFASSVSQPVERKELHKLRKTVDKYQDEIEKLKEMVARSTRASKRASRDEIQQAPTRDRDASQKAAPSRVEERSQAKRKEKQAAGKVPSHVNHKRPRAKATATKMLKKQKLATTKTVVVATKTVVHKSEGSAADATQQVLSREQKVELQKRIDELPDDQFDRVLAFLEPELGNPNDDEIRLDIDTLSPARQHALVALVSEELLKLQTQIF